MSKRKKRLTADQDAILGRALFTRDPEKVLAELDTPQEMLKRLQKSLKDPYPRPWTVVGYGFTSPEPEVVSIFDARREQVPLERMPRPLARLIVNAVNAQHDERQWQALMRVLSTFLTKLLNDAYGCGAPPRPGWQGPHRPDEGEMTTNTKEKA